MVDPDVRVRSSSRSLARSGWRITLLNSLPAGAIRFRAGRPVGVAPKPFRSNRLPPGSEATIRDSTIQWGFTFCPVSLNGQSSAHSEMKEANLGETLRHLRGVAQLSLRALAEKTGFSASFLSQVENGQASPSIASMERIAAALGVTMGRIFDGPEPPTAWPAVIRADARVTLNSEWSKARIETLGTAGPGGRLEPVLLTLASGGTSGTRPYSSNREEFALVMEGTVVLALEEHEQHAGGSEQRHELRKGDAVTIRAGIARRWQNLSPAPVQILMVSAR